jgi:hypothetical protein
MHRMNDFQHVEIFWSDNGKVGILFRQGGFTKGERTSSLLYI